MKWVALSVAIAAGLGIGIYFALQDGEAKTAAGRADVNAFMAKLREIGTRRFELKGSTITIYDCDGAKPRWYPDVPPGITLECVDGFKGATWRVEGK